MISAESLEDFYTRSLMTYARSLYRTRQSFTRFGFPALRNPARTVHKAQDL